jgi:hypothetical protein
MKPSEAVWRKASRSTENGGNCVELASVGGLIAVRDSKDPDGVRVVLRRRDFWCLVEALRAG